MSKLSQVSRQRRRMSNLQHFSQHHAVLVAVQILFMTLSVLSPAFLTTTNILNQNAPPAIMASALTIVIISGGFDLSVGSIFVVTGMVAAAVAVNVDPHLGLLAAPLVGAAMGLAGGLIITRLNVHSFRATIATGMVFRSLVLLFSGGVLISIRIPEFAYLGRGSTGGVFYAVIIMALFALVLTLLLNGTAYGRLLVATGGNENAAILAGIKTRNVKIAAFLVAGLAAGLAGAIATSRLSMVSQSLGRVSNCWRLPP